MVAVLVGGGGAFGGRVAGGVRTAICMMTGACDRAEVASQQDGADADAGEISVETVAELATLAAGGSPSAVAAFFETLTLAQHATLAAEHPGLVGGLDGAPLAPRYEANRALIEQAAAEERVAEVDRLRALRDDESNSVIRAATLEEAIALAERDVEESLEWAASDRQFLLFDAADGRAVEVLGDLRAADHVAYFVPGAGSDIHNFDSTTLAYGELLQDGIADRSPDAQTATIAWLGYDAPGAVDAARAEHAEDAAGVLPARLRRGCRGADRRPARDGRRPQLRVGRRPAWRPRTGWSSTTSS